MTKPKHLKGGPPGRATKQQEVEAWLQSLDLSPEVVKEIRAADPRVQIIPTGAPGSTAEMYERAKVELWKYYESAKGVAKVQTFKEIEKLARAERGEDGGEVEPDPLIADVVTGVVSLSPIRKRQILTVEHERLLVEVAAVETALAQMDEVMVA